MRHFLAYHNEADMGADYNPLSVVTSKPIVKECKNQVVWLVQGSGSKSPKVFFLSSRFIVDSIEESQGGDFAFGIQGKGQAFEPNSIPLNELPWFPKLKRLTGSFGFGFCEIKDPQLIESLEHLVASHSTH